jgi:hypothetical protein
MTEEKKKKKKKEKKEKTCVNITTYRMEWCKHNTKTLACSSIVVCPGTHNDGWTAVATITMRFGNGVAIDLNRGELKVWTVAEDEKEKEEFGKKTSWCKNKYRRH